MSQQSQASTEPINTIITRYQMTFLVMNAGTELLEVADMIQLSSDFAPLEQIPAVLDCVTSSFPDTSLETLAEVYTLLH